jgi:hypothetical protein
MKHEALKPKVLPAARGSVLLQRKCACGGPAVARGECEDCKKKKTLQKKTAGPAVGSNPAAPPIVHEVLQSPGQPLDSATRQFFELRLGHDFGRVRVHTDEKAGESAGTVNARAYTVGSNVVFGAGEYAPGVNAGRELIAHELVHTIQQGDVAVATGTLRIGETHDSFEVEADRAAQASLAGGSTSRPAHSPVKLARQQARPESQQEEEEKKKKEREEQIRRLLTPGGPSTETREEKEEREKKQAEHEAQNKRKKEVRESAKSKAYGRDNLDSPGTWGWGSPETNNLKQECKVVGMDRPTFLTFLSTFPAGSPGVVFGQTAIVASRAVAPEIAAVAVPGGFKLKPTHAEMPPVYSAFTKATEFDEGMRHCPDPGCSRTPNANNGRYKITPGGAAQLEAGEMEHCKDYREAFDLSLALYASIINNLAAHERIYSSERQVVEDAIRQVGIRPDDMVTRFESLCALSTRRDSLNWHRPNFPSSATHVDICDQANGCRTVETIDDTSLPNVGNHQFAELLPAAPTGRSGGKP